MILLLLVMVYPLVFSVLVLVLNDRALIPGTSNYKRRQLLRQEEVNVERARTAAITAKYRLRENEAMEQQLKQITAG